MNCDVYGLDNKRLVGAVLPVKQCIGPQYQKTHTDFVHISRDVPNYEEKVIKS